MNIKLKSILNTYKATALIAFSSLLILLFLNGGFILIGKISGKMIQDTPLEKKYSNVNLKLVYPDLNESDIKRLLDETWGRPLEYEDFTGFREKMFSGKFVNVDANGYRHGASPVKWPPQNANYNVFIFGGSTTFGYGVPDWETFPSYLPDKLNNMVKSISIYNFGRAFYNSSQELVLFERLLVQGYIPNMVVFVDGLNDFYYSIGSEIQHGIQLPGEERNRNWSDALYDFFDPIRTFINNVKSGMKSKAQLNDEEKARYSDPAAITKAYNRYLSNKKIIQAIASSYGIKTIFVWQPVPTYAYDEQYHIFAKKGFGKHEASRYGYKYAKQRRLEAPIEMSDVIWCADIQKEIKSPLYVDLIHYTGVMNKMLADCVMRKWSLN